MMLLKSSSYQPSTVREYNGLRLYEFLDKRDHGVVLCSDVKFVNVTNEVCVVCGPCGIYFTKHTSKLATIPEMDQMRQDLSQAFGEGVMSYSYAEEIGIVSEA